MAKKYAKRKSNRNRYTKKDWKPGFLDELRKVGVVLYAATHAGVHRKTVWRERRENPAFSADYDDALQDGTDALEAEARRRALDGVLRKKFTKSGEPIIDPETGEQYVEREHSDALLQFLLRAKRPEEFGDKSEVKHSGNVQFNPITLDGDKEANGDDGSGP